MNQIDQCRLGFYEQAIPFPSETSSLIDSQRIQRIILLATSTFTSNSHSTYPHGLSILTLSVSSWFHWDHNRTNLPHYSSWVCLLQTYLSMYTTCPIYLFCCPHLLLYNLKLQKITSYLFTPNKSHMDPYLFNLFINLKVTNADVI